MVKRMALVLAISANIAWPAVATAQSDVAVDAIPDLSAPEARPRAGEGDKYFYFNRPGTSFAEALADIRQCDAFARGLNPDTGQASMVSGLAVGLVVGLIDSGNRHHMRRVNIRRCMFFKGYARYGVSKSIWQTFNLEEGGNSGSGNSSRDAMLEVQAKIASGPKPDALELGE